LEYNVETEKNIIQVLTQFIVNTVGIAPTGITLRSCGMHAISTSIALTLDSFKCQYDSATLFIFVEETIYYEVINTLTYLLQIPKPRAPYMSIKTSSNGLSTYISHNNQIIYDVYIASFEANVGSFRQSIDLTIFIDNQLRLRTEKKARTHAATFRVEPLVVLIDNTMSDVDEAYLPSLLRKFKCQIDSGELSILVTHSGNKYLTLGTDKGLATLLYGYYNASRNQVANTINHLFVTENAFEQLGGFALNSPTVLLTSRYLRLGLDEIKWYKKSLHQKACVISSALLLSQY
jgi:hypothetical protein